jgi:hypothetical protein
MQSCLEHFAEIVKSRGGESKRRTDVRDFSCGDEASKDSKNGDEAIRSDVRVDMDKQNSNLLFRVMAA